MKLKNILRFITFRLCLLMCLSMLSPLEMLAQNGKILSGTVLDENGEALIGATVTESGSTK